MKPLPKPIRLALRALRTALIDQGADPQEPMCEALWDLAHKQPSSAMALAETITDAALDIGKEAGPAEPAQAIGFHIPNVPADDEPLEPDPA